MALSSPLAEGEGRAQAFLNHRGVVRVFGLPCQRLVLSAVPFGPRAPEVSKAEHQRGSAEAAGGREQAAELQVGAGAAGVGEVWALGPGLVGRKGDGGVGGGGGGGGEEEGG